MWRGFVLAVAACAPSAPPASAPMIRLGASHDEPLAMAPRVVGPAAQLAVGGGDSCARTPDGRVVCWGQWGSKILPPTFVADLSDAIEIAVGEGHACARRRTGAVVCWGNNRSWWQGMTSTQVLPIEPVDELAGATAIGHGAYFACALGADHQVRCMGANADGQLGDGTLVGRAAARPVVGLTDVRELAVGATHACARLGSGAVKCWGSDIEGELGDEHDAPSPLPVEVVGPHDAVALAVGTGISCARNARGEVRCWGRVLGLGEHASGYVATGGPKQPVDPGWHDAVAIWAGDHEVCARLAAGTIACLGGVPDTHRALAGIKDVAEIRMGVRFGCLRTDGGQIGCWGADEVPGWSDVASIAADGLCALTTAGHVTCTPGSITVPPLDDIAELLVTRAMRCVRKRNGDVACMDNYHPEPHVVTTHAAQLAGTFDTLCARLASGRVTCWGEYLLPSHAAEVPGLSAVEIAVGGGHACARLADGRVKCWGEGGKGQRGDGSTNPDRVPAPVLVQGITSAIGIAAGADHSCALLASGTVRCWGWNRSGQLGDGSTEDSAVPREVAGLGAVVQLVAHGTQTCALLADGTARCWGNDEQGQLGDATDGHDPHSHVTTVVW